MTPADRRELCAILRRVFKTFRACRGIGCCSEQGELRECCLHCSIEEIDAIEKEIEPCQTEQWTYSPSPYSSLEPSSPSISSHESQRTEPCPTPTSETSGAPTGTPARPVGTATIVPTTTSLPTDNPPDLDAIRKAWNRLRDAREGYLRSERRCEDVRPIGEAVDALLALDVPAAVDAQAYDLRHYRAAYPAMKQRAEAAEARVKELETRTAEDHDAICRQAQRLRELSQPGYADAVRRYEFANARAEAAEALADLAEGKCVRLERELTDAKEQRDDALIRAAKAEQACEIYRDTNELNRQLIEKAERELTNVALALEVMSNGVKKAEQERDEAQRDANIEGERADTYRSKWQEAALRIEALTRERDEARAQIATARDAALEEAAVRADAQARDHAAWPSARNAVTDLAAAIRAMKGKK